MTPVRLLLATALIGSWLLVVASDARADGEGILVVTQSMMAAGATHHRKPLSPAKQSAINRDTTISSVSALLLVYAGLAGAPFLHSWRSKRQGGQNPQAD